MIDDWPFDDIPPLSAQVLLADPPWRFELRSSKGEKKSPQNHYRCMMVDELAALPVSKLCDRDCLLFMWTTWPMLASGNTRAESAHLVRGTPDVALPAAIHVMRSWGFKPVTGGAWFKRSPNDRKAMGPGYVMRSACEPFLIGRMGSPAIKAQYGAIETEIDTDVDDGLAIRAATREHSRKPDCVYELLDNLLPRAVNGVELFARQTWTSSKIRWRSWGNEVEKYEAAE